MAEKVTIGNAELWHGDCREVLPMLPDFDLILTDPPYGIGYSDSVTKKKAVATAKWKTAKAVEYGEFGWDEKLPEWVIALILDKADTQILFGGNYYQLPPCAKWLVWDKQTNGNFTDCELAWTNMKGGTKIKHHLWNGFQRAENEDRCHPTQKPVRVMDWCLSFALNATTVCDPFMGSGTTGVACARAGKQFTGIERERKYFDIACERIEQAQAQGQLLPPEQPEPAQQHSVELSPNAEAQLPPEREARREPKARQRFGRSTAALCWAKSSAGRQLQVNIITERFLLYK